MSTIITDRNLIAILKGANALAREIIARHPHLFGEQAIQRQQPPPVGTDPREVPPPPPSAYRPHAAD